MSFVNETDPSKLYQYLNKHVKVNCKSRSENNLAKSLNGWLYTIDPVSMSAVLVNFDAENRPTDVQIICGEEIDNIETLESDSTQLKDKLLSNLFLEETVRENEHIDVEKVREDLVDWLKKNFLPVKLENDQRVNILDSVYINPPYRVENCESTNEIILDKVRNLISKFYSSQNE